MRARVLPLPQRAPRVAADDKSRWRHPSASPVAPPPVASPPVAPPPVAPPPVARTQRGHHDRRRLGRIRLHPRPAGGPLRIHRLQRQVPRDGHQDPRDEYQRDLHPGGGHQARCMRRDAMALLPLGVEQFRLRHRRARMDGLWQGFRRRPPPAALAARPEARACAAAVAGAPDPTVGALLPACMGQCPLLGRPFSPRTAIREYARRRVGAPLAACSLSPFRARPRRADP